MEASSDTLDKKKLKKKNCGELLQKGCDKDKHWSTKWLMVCYSNQSVCHNLLFSMQTDQRNET